MTENTKKTRSQDPEWGANWVQTNLTLQGRLDRNLTPDERRIANMLHWVYRGVYHIGQELRSSIWKKNYVRITMSHTGSTWDNSELTRLVVGAHDFGIRLEINGASHGWLWLEMWPRSRDRRRGHPTLERSLERMHRAELWWDEIEVPV